MAAQAGRFAGYVYARPGRDGAVAAGKLGRHYGRLLLGRWRGELRPNAIVEHFAVLILKALGFHKHETVLLQLLIPAVELSSGLPTLAPLRHALGGGIDVRQMLEPLSKD